MVLARSVQSLQQWLATLDRSALRDAAYLVPLQPRETLPNGRPFRGISILRDLYLGRDRRFYGRTWDNDELRVLPLDDVVARCSLSFIQMQFNKTVFESKRVATKLNQQRKSRP